MWNKLKRIVLVLSLTGIVAATVSTVSAHAELKSAKPSPGEVVSAPPSEIELIFSEPMEDSHIMLYQTKENTPVALEQSIAEPSEKIVGQITEEITEGEYTVFWQATSVDGHMLTGSYNFAYTADNPLSILERPLYQGLVITIFFIVFSASVWVIYRQRTCQTPPVA